MKPTLINYLANLVKIVNNSIFCPKIRNNFQIYFLNSYQIAIFFALHLLSFVTSQLYKKRHRVQ